jgi:hypothetical protein
MHHGRGRGNARVNPQGQLPAAWLHESAGAAEQLEEIFGIEEFRIGYQPPQGFRLLDQLDLR